MFSRRFPNSVLDAPNCRTLLPSPLEVNLQRTDMQGLPLLFLLYAYLPTLLLHCIFARLYFHQLILLLRAIPLGLHHALLHNFDVRPSSPR